MSWAGRNLIYSSVSSLKKVGVPYVQQVLRDLGHYTLKVSPLLVAVGGRQIIRLLRKFYTFLPF